VKQATNILYSHTYEHNISTWKPIPCNNGRKIAQQFFSAMGLRKCIGKYVGHVIA
jgi:hypothetical protein